MPPYKPYSSPYSSLFGGDSPPQAQSFSSFMPEVQRRPYYNFTMNKKTYSMPWDSPGIEPSDLELQEYAFQAEQPKGLWEKLNTGLTDIGERAGRQLAEPMYRFGDMFGPTPGPVGSALGSIGRGAGAFTESFGKTAGDLITSPLGLMTGGGGMMAKGLMGATPLVRGIGQVGRASEIAGGAGIAGHGMGGMYEGFQKGEPGTFAQGALETALGGLGARSGFRRPTRPVPTTPTPGPLPQVSEVGLAPRGGYDQPRLGPGPGFAEGEVVQPAGPRGPGGLGRGNPPSGPFDAPGTILGEVMELPQAEGIQVGPQTPTSMPRSWYGGRRGLASSLYEAEDVGRAPGGPGESAFNALIPERFKPPVGMSNLGERGPFDYVPYRDPAQGSFPPGPPYTPPTPEQMTRFPGRPAQPTGIPPVGPVEPPSGMFGTQPPPRPITSQIPAARIRSAGEQFQAPGIQPPSAIGATPALPDVGSIVEPQIPPLVAPRPARPARIPKSPKAKVPRAPEVVAKEEADVEALGAKLRAVLDKAEADKNAARTAVAPPVAEAAVSVPAGVPAAEPAIPSKAVVAKVEKAVAKVEKAKALDTRIEPLEKPPVVSAQAAATEIPKVSADVENVARVLERQGHTELAADIRSGEGRFKLKAFAKPLTDDQVKEVAGIILRKAGEAPVKKAKGKKAPEGMVTKGTVPKGEKPTAYENFTDDQVLTLARQENPLAITEAHRRRIDKRIRPQRETAEDVVRFKKPTTERIKNEPAAKTGKGELKQFGRREFRSLSDVGEEGLVLKDKFGPKPEIPAKDKWDVEETGLGKTPRISGKELQVEGSPAARTEKIEAKMRKVRENQAKKKGTWKFGSQTTEKGFDVTAGFDPVEAGQRLYGAAKSGYQAAKKAYQTGAQPHIREAKAGAKRAAYRAGAGEVAEAAREVGQTGSAFTRSVPDMLRAIGQSGITTLEKMGPGGKDLVRQIQKARIKAEQLAARYMKEGMSEREAAEVAQDDVWEGTFREFTGTNKKGDLTFDWTKLDDWIDETEDPQMARQIVNKHFGRTAGPGDRTAPFVKRAAEIETAAKLSQFFISNIANVVMTGSRSNIGAMSKAAKKMTMGEGSLRKSYQAAVKEAAETGSLQPIANELRNELGMSKRVGEWLGIEKSEQIQRTFASIAGKHTADDLFSQIKKGKGGETARRRLQELLLEDDLSDIMRQGKLSKEQQLLAGNRMSEITQGRAGSIDLPPLWTKHPVFNLLTQFKRYAFTQSKNIKDAMKVDPIRTAAGLAIGGAGVGELVGDTKALMNAVGHAVTNDDTFKESVKKKFSERGEGLDRLGSNYADAWALGLMLDAARSFSRGEAGGISFAAGPFAQDISRAGSSVYEDVQKLRGKRGGKVGNELFRQGLEAVPLFGRGMSQGLAIRNQPSRAKNPMFDTR